MQKTNTNGGKPIDSNPRSRIIETYLSTIENSFRENRPQIKLVNYGTGSGKTHQLFRAVCKTIKKYPDVRIVGLYIAPLREHLQAPEPLKDEFPNIPFYTLYSLEWKTTDAFIHLYKKWIPLIVGNKKLWGYLVKASSPDKAQEAKQGLNNVKKVISQFEFLKKAEFGNDDFLGKRMLEAQRNINSLMEKFLEFLIKNNPDENYWPNECIKLAEIFYPLHLLREKSGFLMLTYDKFETGIPYFDYNGEKWVKKTSLLDKYICQHSDASKKFILAFDEQEDGYQIMLDHQIDIISPKALAINNALSSINREFSVLFSVKNPENREFLNFLWKNSGAFREFEEHFEKGKEIEGKLLGFAQTYDRLIYEEGNSPNFLNQVATISEGIDKSLKDIVGVFGDNDEEKPIILDFAMLSRVFSKFENNRSLLIPQKLYSKYSDDLMNIFSYNNLFIYNIEPLKNLFLSRHSGGHVHITEQKDQDNASVAELIYAIFAVRLQIEAIREFLTNVLDAEDSQSRSLDIWSTQIARIQKASEVPAINDHPIKYLNRLYVYQSFKTIINIMEIARYQHPTNNLINRPLREVSIGSTAILTSPEHRINSILENNSNVIFLISATGGVLGDLSTSYDMRYLEDKLRNESGQSSFKAMIDEELRLCEEIRQHRGNTRQVSVEFFDENLSSFPNIHTRDLVERFEKQVLKDFISSHDSEGNWFGVYKIQELQNFVRFLFNLLEDDSTQETIAFTQTLRWIKELVEYSEKLHHINYRFRKSSEHPNIYTIQVTNKKYQSNIRVKLIFYEASFNNLYYDKTIQKTYLDELVEEDNQKIFFISAYQSASKGLNPIIRTKNGVEKDFDSLVLLMDKYYSVIGPTLKKPKDSGEGVTLFHFALMKSIVHLGDSNIEIKNFNKYINQPEAAEFRDLQHQILLGKGILQAIGRTERRDYSNQVGKIFINEETRKNLVNFFRYLNRAEPGEIRKLSVNNHEVFLRVQEEEKKRTIRNYDEHIYNEIDASIALHQFRAKMLGEIERFHQDKNAFAITQLWDMLRDPIVFQNPPQYFENLRKSGLFPQDFIDSLFYHNTEQPAFIPYLTAESGEGKTFQIISDSIHGEKVYPYKKRLYPEYLKMNSRGYDLEGSEITSINQSTAAIQKLYKKLIPLPDVFNEYIPRPNFFYDVLYPSLSENFAEEWIHSAIFRGKDWKLVKATYGFEPLVDYRKYNKLYERFDLYYIRGATLFCIDVKAWSVASGYRLSQKTLDKAQNKINTICSDYPEFRTVRGLLLNLHAPQEKSHQYSSTLFSGNLIYFDENNFPVESDILKDFLFTKEE